MGLPCDRSQVCLHIGQVVVHGLRQVVSGLVEVAVYVGTDLHRHTVKLLSVLSHSSGGQLEGRGLVNSGINHRLGNSVTGVDTILGQLLGDLAFALSDVLSQVELSLCGLHFCLKDCLIRFELGNLGVNLSVELCLLPLEERVDHILIQEDLAVGRHLCVIENLRIDGSELQRLIQRHGEPIGNLRLQVGKGLERAGDGIDRTRYVREIRQCSRISIKVACDVTIQGIVQIQLALVCSNSLCIHIDFISDFLNLLIPRIHHRGVAGVHILVGLVGLQRFGEDFVPLLQRVNLFLDIRNFALHLCSGILFPSLGIELDDTIFLIEEIEIVLLRISKRFNCTCRQAVARRHFLVGRFKKVVLRL